MSPPSVSVVMPARNAEKTIAASVASLQAQDLGDFEIVLVDHASDDGTGAIMAQLAREDERIRVHRWDGTFVGAVNLAWQAATGDLIARMDADDLAHPARLRLQRDFLETHPDLAGCGALVRIRKRLENGEFVPADGGYQRYERWINGVVSPEAIGAERFVDSPLPNPTMMLRREVLADAGGYADPEWAEDYDLWLRLLGQGQRLGKVSEVLLDWLDGPTRATRSQDRYSLARFQDAKAHYLSLDPLVREKGVVLCGAGPTGKDFAKRLRRHEVVIHAFLEVNERQIGQRIAGLPVLPSDRAAEFTGLAVMLSAAGREPARETIRLLITNAGFVEGRDFFCVA